MGGGGDTTNITNTGLGDDQYKALTQSQDTIRNDISTGGADIQNTVTTGQGEIKDNLNTGFGNVIGGQDTINTNLNTGFGNITSGQDTINTNLNTGFSNMGSAQEDLHKQIFGAGSFGEAYDPFRNDWEGAAKDSMEQIVGLKPMDMAYDVNGDGTVNISDSIELNRRGAGLVEAEYNDPRTDAYTNGSLVGGITSDFDNTNTKIDEGFGGVNDSLNTINTGVGNVGTQVAGVSDSLNTMNTGVNERFDTLNTGLDNRFNTLSSGMDTKFTDLSKGVLDGQAALTDKIGSVGGSLDTYYSDLAAKQAAQQSALGSLQQGVSGVQSSYDAGEKAAVQARSQMADQITGGFDQTIDKIATTADAAATARDNMASSIGGSIDSVTDNTKQQFTDLGTAVQEGYTEQSVQAQQQKIELANKLAGVRELLQTTGDNLGTQAKSTYTQLVDSFDAQGNLIEQSVSATGNTIQRSVDEQGNLILNEVDQAGNQISSNGLNIEKMLSDAEAYSTQLTNTINKNYGDTINRMEGQGDALFNQLGQMGSQQDVGFDNLGRRIDSNLNNVQTSIQDQQGTIQAGFDQQRAQMGSQITDFAKMASGIADLDSQQRAKFSELGSAFDQQGNLIKNSIDANGNTISRAVDAQGNLILRSFNQQGEAMGSNVLNISNALYELSQIQRQPGANTFGGQLSPAYTAGVQPSNVNSGLMSPYAQTRG
jgi:hypothetical protein